jgi:hypothetical protein
MYRTLSLLVLAACTDAAVVYGDGLGDGRGLGGVSADSALVLRGGVLAPIHGAAFRGNQEVWLGMLQMVCKLDTPSAEIVRDLDIDLSAPERVIEADGDLVVAVPELVITTTTDGDLIDRTPVPGLIDVLATDGGRLVALVESGRGACAVRPDLHEAPVPLTGTSCNGGEFWTVDRATGTTFLPSVAGLVEVSPDGELSQHAVEGDRVSYDPHLDRLYTAWTGHPHVMAWDHDRQLVWSAEVNGPVRALKTLGDDRAVLVLSTGGYGTDLHVLDGYNGAVHPIGSVASMPERVAVSDDGTVITLFGPDGATIYELGPWLNK